MSEHRLGPGPHREASRSRAWRILLVGAAVAAAALLAAIRAPRGGEAASAPVVADASAPVFPDAAWTRGAPSALGWDPAALRELKRALGFASAGCVVRYGYLVHEWDREWARLLWPPARRRGWASATKPFLNVSFSSPSRRAGSRASTIPCTMPAGRCGAPIAR